MVTHSVTLLWAPHLSAVSELSDEVQTMKNERDVEETKLVVLNRSHAQLRLQFEKLMGSLPAHVTLEEHQEALDSIQR